MGFLAPLYAAGIAAITLPILFHLIRRTPRGRVLFSSLMFLTPSPPRITRRSRLEHLLLLALRASALALIALAFCRPFVREIARIGLSQPPGRRIALLIDTSASMDRGDLWRRAQAEAAAVLDQLTSSDQVALFTFDQQLKTMVSFDQTNVTRSESATLVRKELARLRPSWHRTELGASLAALADLMESDADAARLYTGLRIVLISDLQEGARLDPLQDVQWPNGVHVEPRVVTPSEGNAGVQLLPSGDASSLNDAYRVRIVNDQMASRENFSFHWIDRAGGKIGSTHELYVPAGQSRVISVPMPAEELIGLRLADDPFEFDNRTYAAPLPLRQVSVLFIGNDSADDTSGLLFYFQSALVEKGRRQIELRCLTAESVARDDWGKPDLIVVAAPVPDEIGRRLRAFIEAGGTVVLPARDAAVVESHARQLSIDVRCSEAEVANYAMLADIDFRHPMFLALADPRFSDFTKIRFWHFRRLELSEPFQTVARFDTGDVAIAQASIGAGRIVVLASTWSPADSQWAVSTKWVPLVESWLEMAAGKPPEPVFAQVGDSVRLPWDVAPGDAVIWRPPAGSEVTLPPGAQETPVATEPGAYELVQGSRRQVVAVNIDPNEMRTTPVDPTALEQFGVRLSSGTEGKPSAEVARQLHDQELEGRQGLWRWLIVAAIVILLAETWLAGRTAASMRAESAPSG